MAAPEYVPQKPAEKVRSYTSPPWSGDPWMADRPGELAGAQPRGAHLGSQGPDQGYALTLVKLFADSLHLTDGEHVADVNAGVVLVGLKRASIFGRAPVRHDLEIGYRIFGFLDATPSAELVELRRHLFEEARSSHHYAEVRQIPDRVSDEALRKTPKQVAADYERDWRSNLNAVAAH